MFPPLQRLSYLLPSTASDEIKLGEAQRVHDDFTSKAEELKPAGNKKVFRDGIQHRHMSVLCQPICGDSLCSCSEAEATGAERHQAEAARSAGGAEGSPAHSPLQGWSCTSRTMCCDQWTLPAENFAS